MSVVSRTVWWHLSPLCVVQLKPVLLTCFGTEEARVWYSSLSPSHKIQFLLVWLTSQFSFVLLALLESITSINLVGNTSQRKDCCFFFAILYSSRPATLQNSLHLQGRFCNCQHCIIFIYLCFIMLF